MNVELRQSAGRLCVGVLVLWSLHLQAQAQTLEPRDRLDGQGLTRLLTQQEDSVINSHNDNFHFENCIVSGEAFVSEVLRLSDRVAGIEAGERPYLVVSKCTIEGGVVLDNRKISIPLQFNNVIFQGKFSLKGATLENPLSFTNNCMFEQQVILSKASINAFGMGFDLKETIFMADVIADRTTFVGSTSFGKAVFRRWVSFTEAQFKDRAQFDRVSFGDTADFTRTTFFGSASFSFATFERFANFTSVTFERGADFSGTGFNNLVTYLQARFKGQADFGGAHVAAAFFYDAVFGESASFNQAKFKRHVDLKSAKFSGETDFEGCEFPSMSAPYEEARAVNYLSPGLGLWDTRFEKRVRLSFNQLLDGPAWQPFRNPHEGCGECARPRDHPHLGDFGASVQER